MRTEGTYLASTSYPRHLLTVSRAVTVPLPLLTCSLRSPAERSGSGEERTTTRSQEVTEGSTGDGNHVDSSWTVYPLSVPLIVLPSWPGTGGPKGRASPHESDERNVKRADDV